MIFLAIWVDFDTFFSYRTTKGILSKGTPFDNAYLIRKKYLAYKEEQNETYEQNFNITSACTYC